MRASELRQEALEILGDEQMQYFTAARILRHLNRALRDVSQRARTIRGINYRQVNEGQHVYGLPPNFLELEKAAWFAGGQWYPLLRRRLTDTQLINHGSVLQSWRPFYFNVWGRSRAEKVLLTVSEVTSGGAPSFNQTFRFTDATSLQEEQGLASILVGDVIFNATDNSEGMVMEITGMNSSDFTFRTLALEGGTRPELEVGDEVRIVAPNVSRHVVHVAPPPQEDSQTGEERLWLYFASRHYTITQDAMDNGNDELEVDLELETPVLERLIYWARRDELGVSDPEVIAQLATYQAAYHEALPFVRQRLRDFQNTWGQPEAGMGLGNIEIAGGTTSAEHPLNRLQV